MNHAMDVFAGLTALIIAAALVLYPDAPMPRAKPAPPPVETVSPAPAAKPSPPPADNAARAQQIERDITAVRKEIAEIKEAIRLQQAVKSLPDESTTNESGGPR